MEIKKESAGLGALNSGGGASLSKDMASVSKDLTLRL